MGRRAGAAGKHSPAAGPHRQSSVLRTARSAHEWGLAGGRNSLFQQSDLFREFGLFPGVWRVLQNSLVWWNPGNPGKCSRKSADSAIAARGLAMQLVVGWWEKLHGVQLVLHILYYYSTFLCHLIKLSVSQPTSFTFSHSPIPLCGEEWVSGCVILAASCQVKPWQGR